MYQMLSKNQPNMLSFFLVTLVALFPIQLMAAATLHTIIVADVTDTGIGADVDQAKLQKLEDAIERATCLKVKRQVIHVGRGKSDEVKKAVSELSVNPDDVVFFYYSGHGANLGDGSIWPVLAVEGQRTRKKRLVKLEWVKKTIQRKNPRFFLVMADACNVFISGGERSSRRQLEQPNGYKKLFLDTQGYVVASSSVPDQYSFGDPQNGGYFTRAFLGNLNEALGSSNPDWNTIMTGATETIRVNHKQGIQNPQADVQVTYTKTTSREPGWCQTPPTGDTSLKPISDDEGPSQHNTCAKAKYHRKDGQKCCWDSRGNERCFHN